MDPYKFHDIKAEKANAISRNSNINRITTLFRFLEVFVFLIIVSRFSTQFSFSFNFSSENFRGISVTLISPRFVFLLGNAIIAVLFFKSGQFSSKSGEKTVDFYDEYAEKCRRNQQQTFNTEKEKIKASSDLCRKRVGFEEIRKMRRCESENLEKAARRRDLRRSVSDKYRKIADCRRPAAAAAGGGKKAEDEMSSEEFRRTVEAFIARQQRVLREEEEEEGFSAVVSV